MKLPLRGPPSPHHTTQHCSSHSQSQGPGGPANSPLGQPQPRLPASVSGTPGTPTCPGSFRPGLRGWCGATCTSQDMFSLLSPCPSLGANTEMDREARGHCDRQAVTAGSMAPQSPGILNHRYCGGLQPCHTCRSRMSSRMTPAILFLPGG